MSENIFVTKTSLPAFEEYIEAIRPLWDTHWVTNMGPYHMSLEEELKKYLDVENFSLMVNGHMALELVLQAFDFPKGGEVITTPFTFISTTHAIVRCGLTPVFCDVKSTDGTIDETRIEDLITDRTVAIMPVHVYGNVCAVEEIQCLADKYKLKVIYDAAHAFGVRYKGKGIGRYGDASVFSFHATKVYHTIEGGGVAFSNPELYDKLYNLKNFGIQNEELVVEVGANAKMNELCAIMGLCNLKHIDAVLQGRKKRDELYRQRLGKLKGIRLFNVRNNASRNYAYFPILVEKSFCIDRNQLYDILKEHNIYSRKYFYPLTSDQECYNDYYKNANLETARQLAEQVLTLPLYDSLSIDDLDKICSFIEELNN